MPHARSRHVLPLLLKRLKFSPVLAIQGARQVGKSLLIRDILSRVLPHFEYKTLDRLVDRDFARTNPETFLQQFSSASTIALDEAQKAPSLFDAIKFEVDQNRRPGRYILLGSTEFSKLTLVREALTGRMSRLRLFSLNLSETLSLPQNNIPIPKTMAPRVLRKDLLTYLEKGGMPGIFAVRSREERESLQRDWLELTTSRDLLQFPKLRLDPELAMRILEKLATLESPDAGTLAKVLKRDLRRIRTHLHALEALFVVHRLDPHPSGTGKPLYFLFDVGFASLLGANFERQLHTWALQEELSQRMYLGERATQLFYYRTQKGRIIHLLEESEKGVINAIQIFPEEALLSRDLELLRAFKSKNKNKIHLYGLGASARIELSPKIEILPWESIA